MYRQSRMGKTMAVVNVQNIAGEKVSQLDLAEHIFNVPVKTSVLHEVVAMQLANRRSATASVKHRSEDAGSTRKLYRQKGSIHKFKMNKMSAQFRNEQFLS